MNKINYTCGYLILLLFISLLNFGCSQSKTKEKPNIQLLKIPIPSIEVDSIKLVSNKGIEFKYSLGDKSKFGENYRIEIKCIVYNKTDHKINYLNESCNGLDFYIVFKPETYKVMPLMNCNATWGMISKLQPRDSIEFKTHVFQPKNAKPIEIIGLDFRAVDKFIPFQTLQKQPEIIEGIYREKTKKNNIIWSN